MIIQGHSSNVTWLDPQVSWVSFTIPTFPKGVTFSLTHHCQKGHENAELPGGLFFHPKKNPHISPQNDPPHHWNFSAKVPPPQCHTFPPQRNIAFLVIQAVTFLGWLSGPFKGCWWLPTFGDEKVAAWITWLVKPDLLGVIPFDSRFQTSVLGDSSVHALEHSWSLVERLKASGLSRICETLWRSTHGTCVSNFKYWEEKKWCFQRWSLCLIL